MHKLCKNHDLIVQEQRSDDIANITTIIVTTIIYFFDKLKHFNIACLMFFFSFLTVQELQ